VVKELTTHLHRKYRHTYFNNFTSQQLLVDLEKDGVYGSMWDGQEEQLSISRDVEECEANFQVCV